MPLLRPVDHSNNGCCTKKGNRVQTKKWSSHAKRLLLLCSLRVSSEYKVNTWFESSLIKMNDHTQGGGVQIDKLIQIYVLLPSGCQGQVLCWGYDARSKRVGTGVQTCKQAQSLFNQYKTTHNSLGQRQQCSHSKDARSRRIKGSTPTNNKR
jgi:hypothetical protein